MGYYFSISSLIIFILLDVIFIKKKKVDNNETKIFGFLLLTITIGLIFEIISANLFNNGINYNGVLYKSVSKFIFIYYITFCYLFNYYLVSLIKNENKINTIFLIIFSFLTILFPIEFNKVGESITPNGYSLYVTLLGCLYYSIADIFIMIKNYNKIPLNKKIPIFSFLFLGSLNFVILNFFSTSFIMGFVISICIFIMYQTIENPDVKLIEYEKKEIDKIKQAAESKSEFLSSTSHELRTPLNAIIGLSEDIESFKDINPEILDDVKDLVNASNVLLDIISNILDSSKIESGKLDIIECDYDVKNELETIGNIYKIKAFKKNLQFNIDIDGGVPQILFGDRQRIKQVISNLLDNAVKFTDVGKINFIVKWDNLKSNLIIIISDSGDGLRKEQIETFLNEKNDLRIEKIYSAQGTGLGLTISRNLIKLLKGYATIDTKTYAGTKFTIYIPQKIGDIEILNAMNKKVDIDINNLNYTGKRLLVVDDNPINIKVFRKAIKSFNFEIDECYNGKDAINKIELNNNYDLVFMDIMMPVMGGEEAVKKLKEMANFTTPVVALTADAVSGATQKYKNIGFDDYMSKPFSRDMVANKIYSMLGRGDKNE